MVKQKQIFLVLAACLVMASAWGQNGALLADDFYPKLDQLRTEFGKNKSIPPDVELAVLVALSYYPELKNEQVEFVFEKQCDFLLTRPQNRLFVGKKNRRYKVLMTNNSDPANGMVMDHIAFNALVGVIGHELAHVLDYSRKSFYRTAMTGFRYSISKKYRQKLERATDISTVNHGLGYQLFRIRIYFPEGETKAHDSYLSREEILDLIKVKEVNSSAL